MLVAMLVVALPAQKVDAAASGAPGIPQIKHNQWGNDRDGEYIINCDMWYGNNGVSYKLYERIGIKNPYTLVAEGTLTDNTPNAQNFKVSITGRKLPGTYYYYAELMNSYGCTKSETIKLNVGSASESNIVIDVVDDVQTVVQHTVTQGTHTFKLYDVDCANPQYTVVSSNPSVVKASIVNGETLQIEALKAGRSGVQIREASTNDVRQIGIRVKEANGTLPGMSNYLALGQVSEDTTADLNFWKDIDCDDTNKRCDIRYIYINGGPINGWRKWTTIDGERAKKYITESLKLGMIPYFVYYNIPADAESYEVDIAHINDTAYMEAYYKDLKFLLDICNEYAKDEQVGIVLEPDFIGYLMQQSQKRPTQIVANGVGGVYTSGVLDRAKDPVFDNTVTGLIESINYVISKYGKNVTFGWQFNTWGYSEPGTPGIGLMHATETMGYAAGREFIKTGAIETAKYYMEAGILSNGADFISIDKYGLDGGYEPGAPANPAKSKWLWNADLWNNYLFYTKTLHETTKFPVTLWQIPVGRLNGSQEQNPYTGGKFPDLTNVAGNYEDSAPVYFFGDTFNPGSPERMEHFSKNEANDPKITVNGNCVTYGSHMEEVKAAGVTAILFGAGVNASTDAVGDPPTDAYWWITKAQRYYGQPVLLN